MLSDPFKLLLEQFLIHHLGLRSLIIFSGAAAMHCPTSVQRAEMQSAKHFSMLGKLRLGQFPPVKQLHKGTSTSLALTAATLDVFLSCFLHFYPTFLPRSSEQ